MVYRSLRGSEPNVGFGADFLFKQLAALKSVALYAGSQQSVMTREPKVVSFTMSEMQKMIDQEIAQNGDKGRYNNGKDQRWQRLGIDTEAHRNL